MEAHALPRALQFAHGVPQSNSGDNGLLIREYGFIEATELFGAQWNRLLTDGAFDLSSAPEFIGAAAASMGLTNAMRVLVASDGDEVLGVLPFFLKTTRMYGVPLTIINLGGNLVSYHHEIVAKGCQLELLRACLTDRNRPWHALCLAEVPTAGATAAALDQIAKELSSAHLIYPGDAAPHLPISEPWDQYLAHQSGSFRYNLKRKEKALAKGGKIDERWFRTAADVPELYRCMEHIESQSWKKSAHIAVTSTQNESAYYKALLPFLARNDCLFASVIYVDDRPAAYQLGYLFRKRVGNMKTSFDEAFQGLSPGAVVLHHAVQRAFEIGAREFDFLGDNQHHKRLWTEQVRVHASHFLFSRRPRGRAIGMAKVLVQAWRRQEFHHVIRRADVRKSDARAGVHQDEP